MNRDFCYTYAMHMNMSKIECGHSEHGHCELLSTTMKVAGPILDKQLTLNMEFLKME